MPIVKFYHLGWWWNELEWKRRWNFPITIFHVMNTDWFYVLLDFKHTNFIKQGGGISVHSLTILSDMGLFSSLSIGVHRWNCIYHTVNIIETKQRLQYGLIMKIFQLLSRRVKILMIVCISRWATHEFFIKFSIRWHGVVRDIQWYVFAITLYTMA